MNLTCLKKKSALSYFLWDLFLTASIIGIWPRFVEPKLITTTKCELALKKLPIELDGFKILQLSDLHFNKSISDNFLNRLRHKVEKAKPDLIAFTGDFICCGRLIQKERLKFFLSSLKAPYGCFAVAGNHDYNGYISINSNGEYDLFEKDPSQIFKGFERLFTNTTLRGYATKRAQELSLNLELVETLKDSGFTFLHNEARQINVKNGLLNITGLGEHMLGRLQPSSAFKNVDTCYPNIVLLHNPDGIPAIVDSPWDVILSGHTHGGQINLPFIWKKLTLMENQKFKCGLFNEVGKWIYVSRGLGSVMPLRFFAPPEIVCLTLKKSL